MSIDWGKVDFSKMTADERVAYKENFLSRFREDNKIGSVDFMKIWRNYDKDKSGYLEAGELERFLKDLLDYKGQSNDAKALRDYQHVIMQCFDVNKDGKLEIGELSQLLPLEKNFLAKFPNREKLSRSEFNDIFKHYDVDGSGSITSDELVGLIRDIFQSQGMNPAVSDLEAYAEAIREIYDTDHDGKLDREDIGMVLSKT